VAADEGVALAGGIPDKDADLTRTELAKRTTLLMGDASGVVTLFGHAGFVDEEDAVVGITKRASDEALVLSENGKTGPGALSEKGLQTTNRDTQGQSDRCAGFARKGSEQAVAVASGPDVLITTGKGGLEALTISLQGREQGFDIGHGQVAFWQRAGRCYTGVAPGLLPQSR
jgi:hypothetical protein